MPTPKKGPRLGGSPAHQKAILANLATSLFEHGRITTTEAKARLLRPYAERLITKAKRGDLHNRRQVMSVIRDKTVVHVLFTEIGPQFAERPGGYTRITKIGPRKGDNAPMAVIELVQEAYSPGSSSAPARKTTAAKKTAAPAEETPVVDEDVAATESTDETDAPADDAEVATADEAHEAQDEAPTDDAPAAEAGDEVEGATDAAADDADAPAEVESEDADADESADKA